MTATWKLTRRWTERAGLSVALLLATCQVALADAPEADLAVLDPLVAEVDGLVRDAQFHTAIGVARTARAWADEADSTPALRERRARLQVLLATAHVALGDERLARESLRRALALNPQLALDESTTSPKLLKVLREIRRVPPAKGAGS